MLWSYTAFYVCSGSAEVWKGTMNTEENVWDFVSTSVSAFCTEREFGVYARLQRKEGKQAACLSGSRAPSACWDQLVLLRHRNAVVRLEVSWTARRQTRQARHRGFVESGSTAVELNHRPQQQRKQSVCLSSSAFPQARDDRKVVRSLVIDSFCRKLTHCRHVWGWYQ